MDWLAVEDSRKASCTALDGPNMGFARIFSLIETCTGAGDRRGEGVEEVQCLLGPTHTDPGVPGPKCLPVLPCYRTR